MSTLPQHSTGTRTRVRQPESEPRPAQQGGGLSLTTLLIASISSVTSAIVVSHVWGPGTLYGAAATPVIVAFVGEALRRPRRAIENRRELRETRQFDPVAEGRRGLREGEAPAIAPIAPRGRTDHRAPSRPSRLTRRGLVAALATGVVAFAVAAFALTGGELVFGSSSVGGNASRTTLFGGGAPAKQHRGKQSGEQQQHQQQQSSGSGSTHTQQSGSSAPDQSQQTTTGPDPGAGTTPGSPPAGSGGTAVAPEGGPTQTPETTTATPPSGQQPSQTTPSSTTP